MKAKTLFTSLALAGCLFAGNINFQANAQNPMQLILEQRQQELILNHSEAPNFTLQDLEGAEVSLSDFRGHWVVIDFWGSWCGWCIRGLPEMKTAYNNLKDKGVVFLGVDCCDTEQAWRAAVQKYEIPWINVFNPYQGGGEIAASYGIQGYPTKAIIDPEGKVYDIITGEDPQFYIKLYSALGENLVE